MQGKTDTGEGLEKTRSFKAVIREYSYFRNQKPCILLQHSHSRRNWIHIRARDQKDHPSIRGLLNQPWFPLLSAWLGTGQGSAASGHWPGWRGLTRPGHGMLSETCWGCSLFAAGLCVGEAQMLLVCLETRTDTEHIWTMEKQRFLLFVFLSWNLLCCSPRVCVPKTQVCIALKEQHALL